MDKFEVTRTNPINPNIIDLVNVENPRDVIWGAEHEWDNRVGEIVTEDDFYLETRQYVDDLCGFSYAEFAFPI